MSEEIIRNSKEIADEHEIKDNDAQSNIQEKVIPREGNKDLELMVEEYCAFK